MASTPPSTPARNTWKDWLNIIAPAAIVIGAVAAGGGYIGQVKDNTRRIDALEQRSERRDDKLDVIAQRTAAIDAKLSVLLPEKPKP